MAEHSLREQARRFLDGELTFRQLDEFVSESVLHDFRFGETDPVTIRIADNLVGIFSEYDLECELLGDPSEAMKQFRESLLEFIQETSGSASTGMSVEHAPS